MLLYIIHFLYSSLFTIIPSPYCEMTWNLHAIFYFSYKLQSYVVVSYSQIASSGGSGGGHPQKCLPGPKNFESWFYDEEIPMNIPCARTYKYQEGGGQSPLWISSRTPSPPCRICDDNQRPPTLMVLAFKAKAGHRAEWRHIRSRDGLIMN